MVAECVLPIADLGNIANAQIPTLSEKGVKGAYSLEVHSDYPVEVSTVTMSRWIVLLRRDATAARYRSAPNLVIEDMVKMVTLSPAIALVVTYYPRKRTCFCIGRKHSPHDDRSLLRWKNFQRRCQELSRQNGIRRQLAVVIFTQTGKRIRVSTLSCVRRDLPR